MDQLTNPENIEEALSDWVKANLPSVPARDGLWILEHHQSLAHAEWWRSGVAKGIGEAIAQQSASWAEAIWQWWLLSPSAVKWVKPYLSGLSAEAWLLPQMPVGIPGELLQPLIEMCANYNWAILLAKLLGSERPLDECINTLRALLHTPEEGLDELIRSRSGAEIVAAAGALHWFPLTQKASRITRECPDLFINIRETPGLFSLLVEHLKGGGAFPTVLMDAQFVGQIFEGVLHNISQFEFISKYLGVWAGAFAFEHPAAERLLGLLGSEVSKGAEAEWWLRFMLDDRVAPPVSIIRKLVIESVSVRCKNRSIELIIDLMILLPEINESQFIGWMKNYGFYWEPEDYQRVAGFLRERNWRLAVREFRYSWKRELIAVAWYARDLLDRSDRFRSSSPFGALNIEASLPRITQPSMRQKMKITFLASCPANANRLALDEEARLIEEKIRSSKHRDDIQFKTRWAVRPEDLQQALLEDVPDIVHFSGHGGGKIGIALHSGDQGDDRLVAEDALARLFHIFKDNIKLVVLNACYSEVQALAIVQEIDFVVGMSDSVGDEAARVFAAALYRGLAFGLSVKKAFDLGINELSLLGFDHDEYTPRLLVRSGLDPSAIMLVGSIPVNQPRS